MIGIDVINLIGGLHQLPVFTLKMIDIKTGV